MYVLFLSFGGFDMELTFQTARQEDIDVLFRFNKCLIDQYEDTQAIPYEFVLDWVRETIEKNIHTYTRIYADGRHAGFYRFVPDFNRMELDNLYIFPEFQNQGIGTRILEKCCRESDQPVMLYVFSRNTGAWKLYQRMGFEIRETINNTRYIMVREKL